LNFLITPGRASVYAFRTSAPQKTSICRRSSPRQNRQGGRDVKFKRGQSARGHAREKAVRVIGKLRAARRTCSPSPNAPAAHSRRGSFPERQRRPCSDTHQSGLVESGNNSGVSKAVPTIGQQPALAPSPQTQPLPKTQALPAKPPKVPFGHRSGVPIVCRITCAISASVGIPFSIRGPVSARQIRFQIRNAAHSLRMSKFLLMRIAAMFCNCRPTKSSFLGGYP
jgi:hypothetical protein